MGFFSRIKKLWGGDATPADHTPPQSAQEAPAQTEPIEAIEPAPAPAAQPEPGPAGAAQDEQAVTPKTIAAEVEPETAPALASEHATAGPVRTELEPTPAVQPEPGPAGAAQAEQTISPEAFEAEIGPEAAPALAPEHATAGPARVESEPAPTVQTESEPVGAAQPEAVAAPESEPFTETILEPAKDKEPMPEPIRTSETTNEVDFAPTQAKTSGWRRFLGLGPKNATPTETPGTEPAQQKPTQPVVAPDKPKPELLFQEKPSAQPALEPWQENLVAALRGAEPRLSTWMGHILDGVDRRGDILWIRLRFLFTQLDVPTNESEDFIARFDTWLGDMDYDRVEEFRSELQYRMALALDLEDEEDERNRLFLKLSAGLGKTREQLTMRIDQLLSLAGGYDDQFWEELEEILLMADVGVTATQELLKRLKPKVRKAGSRDAAEFKALLKEELIAVFVEPTAPTVPRMPEVVLMVGVNGAGKTTTIAKLAHRAQMQGRKVLVAAGDTFRAAAIEQLQVWSKRVGAGFYAKAHGSDPAAVAFEAVDHAIKDGYDLVFVDTAGRLQTKHNLMEELKKINRVLGKKLEGAPHRTILVLDATTGQNALSQVKLFSQSSPVNEIVLTKLDGTAKGGIIVAIALEFGIPISFVGLGEKMEDLRPFSGPEFANALFD